VAIAVKSTCRQLLNYHKAPRATPSTKAQTALSLQYFPKPAAADANSYAMRNAAAAGR